MALFPRRVGKGKHIWISAILVPQVRKETPVAKAQPRLLGKTIGLLLGGSILFLFLLFGAGIYFFFDYVKDWRIQRASQTAPIEIADHGLSHEEVGELKQRVEEFLNGHGQGLTPNTLKISADELTALVGLPFPHDPASRIRFEIDDDGLFIRGSLSLADWGYSGRYLNARLWVFIDKVSGRFRFKLADIKGHEDVWISGKSLRALRVENLTGYAYGHPQLAPILQRTDQIELQDHAIVFIPRDV